jgi:hypothetical protein
MQDYKWLELWRQPHAYITSSLEHRKFSAFDFCCTEYNITQRVVLTGRDSHYCLQWDLCCVPDLFEQPHLELSLQNSLPHQEENRDCTNSWCCQLSHCKNKNTVKPLFNESLGDWFSYTKSRFSLNGGYAKLHKKTHFFLLIYLLYYMISLYW